jgi:hypothetical protein
MLATGESANWESFSEKLRPGQHSCADNMLVCLIDLDQVVGVVGQFRTGDHVERYFLPKGAEVADGE